MNDPRGSVWRRWDLHVHTPLSYLNSEFDPNFDNYVQTLFTNAINKNINVIGITDYFTIDGYKKIRAEYLNNENVLVRLFTDDEIEKIKKILILPNIEFRLKQTVEKRKVNFHVLFSNHVSNDDIEENFLHKLHIKDEGNPQEQDSIRTLTIRNISAIGKKLKEEHPEWSHDSDIFVGMKNIFVDDNQIIEFLKQNNKLFLGNYLIGIPVDEDLSKFNWNDNTHLIRKIFYQKCNFFFTSNPKTINWALGKTFPTKEDFIKKFKSLKPCLHGSDAHSFRKLFEPDENRYCWIKADPTFEGLRQILYEPEDRVYIGEKLQDEKFYPDKIIDYIQIENSDGWFDEKNKIALNDGLVSVIGGKGTGKTALLDILFYTLGTEKQKAEIWNSDKNKDKKSFYQRAEKDLKKLVVKIGFKDGTDISSENNTESKREKVKYLSQSFVEKICSFEENDILKKQIEDVIFQHIDSEYKRNYTDLKSYLDNKLSIINSQKLQKRKYLLSLNREIFNNDNLIAKSSEIKNNISELKNKIKTIKYELSELTKPIEGQNIEVKGDLTKQSELNKALEETKKAISMHENEISHIEQAQYDLTNLTEMSERIITKIVGNLEKTSFDTSIIKEIQLILKPDNIVTLLDHELAKLKNEISELNSKKQGEKKSLIELNKKITSINESQVHIQKLEVEKKLLENQLEAYNSEEKEIIHAIEKKESKKEERLNVLIEYFDLLLKQKMKMEQIFSPIIKYQKEKTDFNKDELFLFSVVFRFDRNIMAENGFRCFDSSKKGRYFRKDTNAVLDDIKKYEFSLAFDKNILQMSEKDTIRDFYGNIISCITADHPIESQLKKNQNAKLDFYNWLYSVEYYDVEFSIEFNDIQIENLSPGSKGVALLILYLELDKENTNPILIDQPEENLDNRSVYSKLIGYFRQAKKKRQVIIVTHNPNLVVNTDSEQIIVANFEMNPEKQKARICYVSGAIENSFNKIDDDTIPKLEQQGIREHICEILEGGTEAFKKREKKYGFKN